MTPEEDNPPFLRRSAEGLDAWEDRVGSLEGSEYWTGLDDGAVVQGPVQARSPHPAT